MEDPDLPEVVPESVEDVKGFVSADRWPEYANPHYVMPEVIEVKVAIDAETYVFPVQVVKTSGSKPYLGGYRHKISGAIYHHARYIGGLDATYHIHHKTNLNIIFYTIYLCNSTQTPTEQQKKNRDFSNLRTRETQVPETMQYYDNHAILVGKAYYNRGLNLFRNRFILSTNSYRLLSMILNQLFQIILYISS
jgi:hypothetical protein